MFEALKEVKKQCQSCQKCPLGKTRKNIVFSDGCPNSKIMLIGEAPGANEDAVGLPFVGRAGQLLDKILQSVDLSRQKDVYICNTIKCRPPENRDPLPAEKEACRQFLQRQIEILKPRIILLCGRVAMASFLDLKQGITKIHGQWFDGPWGAKMMPIYHPSYLLRNPSKEKGAPKWQMWMDMKEVKRYYDTLK